MEDGWLNGHPVLSDYGPGPFEAVADFIVQNMDFEIDHAREHLMLTQNPNGYLRKKARV